MKAKTTTLDKGLGSKAKKVSGLLGKLNSGSGTTKQSTDGTQLRNVQKEVSSINDFVTNTTEAISLLQGETGGVVEGLKEPLIEISKLANSILSSQVAVSEDQSKKFVTLLDQVETFVKKNEKTNVGGTTLKAFLSAFSAEQGKQTLGSKDAKEKVQKVSDTVGSAFGSFLTNNIKAANTVDFGDAAKQMAVATLAGPLAPIITGISDLVDVKSVFGNISGYAKKGIALVKNKQKARKLAKIDPATKKFRENEIEQLTVLNGSLVDGLKNVQDSVESSGGSGGGDSSKGSSKFGGFGSFKRFGRRRREAGGGGGGSLIGSLAGGASSLVKGAGRMVAPLAAGAVSSVSSLASGAASLAGPLAALAAAGAAGFGIGTAIRKGMDSLTGGGFTKSIGKVLGTTVDHALSLFGNKDAKQRLALAEKMNRPQVSKSQVGDLKSQLGQTGMFSLGTDVKDFQSMAKNLRSTNAKAGPLQRKELITSQIQSLQKSLQNKKLDKSGRAEVDKLVLELQKDREAAISATSPVAKQSTNVVSIASAKQPEITAPTSVAGSSKASSTGKQTIEVRQGSNAPSVNSVPMVNDDMGLQLVNSGTL